MEAKPVSWGIGKKRLLKLAEFLEKLPRKRFDYDRWVGEDWEGAPNLSCGTTACAFGWATAMPLFRRLGLHLRTLYGEGWASPVLKGYVMDTTFGTFTFAAQVLFGVTQNDAEYIFMPETVHDDHSEWREGPSSGATPKEVARHIRRFIALKDKENVE